MLQVEQKADINKQFYLWSLDVILQIPLRWLDWQSSIYGSR